MEVKGNQDLNTNRFRNGLNVQFKITSTELNINAVTKNDGYKSYENKLMTECKWRNSGHKICSLFTTQKK